jgi:hypothetical protein
MACPAQVLTAVAFGAVATFLAGPALAQGPPAVPPPSPSPGPPTAAAAKPADTGQIRRVGSTFAVNGGSPLGFSGSGALIVGRVQTGGDSCPSATGTLLQAEAGVGGGKVSVGRLFFTYCYTRFGSLGAADVKVSLLRTWGAPLWAPADKTYLGPELDIGVADWKIALGLLVRLGEDPATKRLRFTWALGRGF